MMTKAECFNLGYVAKLHGFKGEVSLFFDTTHPEEYQDLESVFIELDGMLTPFFVEKLKVSGRQYAKVKFEGIDTEIEAKRLLKKQLYLPLSLLPKLTGKHFYDHEIIGFNVVDENFGDIGNVQQVVDITNNPLIQVFNQKENKEILLPLNQQLIQKIDRENRVIYISAPDGLVSLYLEI